MLQFLLQFLSWFQRWTMTEETEILGRHRALNLGRISNSLVAFCSFVFRSWDRLLEEFQTQEIKGMLKSGMLKHGFGKELTNFCELKYFDGFCFTIPKVCTFLLSSIQSTKSRSVRRSSSGYQLKQIRTKGWICRNDLFQTSNPAKKRGRIEICSFLTEISLAQIKYLLYGRSNWCNIACHCGERGGRRFYHASGVPWSKSGTVGPFVVRKLHH